mgnify:CR=1 FL=1
MEKIPEPSDLELLIERIKTDTDLYMKVFEASSQLRKDLESDIASEFELDGYTAVQSNPVWHRMTGSILPENLDDNSPEVNKYIEEKIQQFLDDLLNN